MLLALATLPGCAVYDLLTGGPCNETDDQTVDVDGSANDPPAMLHVEQCRVDADACPALCTLVMDRNGITDPQTGCSVTFDGDTAHVDVTYSHFRGGNGCQQLDQSVPTPGGGASL